MRVCPGALSQYLKTRVDTTVLDPTEIMIQSAIACLGIQDQNPMIDVFRSSVSKPHQESWCLDFLQSMIAFAENETLQKSALPASEWTLGFWDQSKVYHSVAPAQRGDLIIWKHIGTMQGHCGIILGQDSLRYTTIEGNTSDTNEIDRDGNGVFMKMRAKGGSKTFVELGFLRVFP